MSRLMKSISEPSQQKPASSEERDGKISEVRELLGDLPKEMPSFLSDATICRFLRARNWSTARAAKSLKEAAKWRRQYQPEKIRWEDIVDSENEAKRLYIPDYLDKHGRAIIVTLPTRKSKLSEKELIKYLVYMMENLVLNSKDAPEENVVWISDFQGWAISSTPFSLTRESIHIIQKYYPGMIAVAILANPPSIFESFWKIMKQFLEPNMKEKVKFVYKNDSDSQRTMAEIFDLDKLESKFGGRNTADHDTAKFAERMKTLDHIRGVTRISNELIH